MAQFLLEGTLNMTGHVIVEADTLDEALVRAENGGMPGDFKDYWSSQKEMIFTWDHNPDGVTVDGEPLPEDEDGDLIEDEEDEPQGEAIGEESTPLDVLESPLTLAQLRACVDEQGLITVVIPLNLFDIIDTGGADGMNDLCDERILGDGDERNGSVGGFMSGLSYIVVGAIVEKQQALVEVTGDVSHILEEHVEDEAGPFYIYLDPETDEWEVTTAADDEEMNVRGVKWEGPYDTRQEAGEEAVLNDNGGDA